MRVQLRPDETVRIEKRKIGSVPVLILRPARIPPYPAAVLWIHGGGYFLGGFDRLVQSYKRGKASCGKRGAP